MYSLQSRASRSRCSIYLVPGTVHASTQQSTNQRYGGLSRAKKLLVSRDYLITRTCYKQSNAFLMRLRRRRSAVSSWNVDPLRNTTLRGIRSARSGLGQRSFSLGDVGEARWPLSHRWTDRSLIWPDAAHDSLNQTPVVSFSLLSLLSSCVRLRQLREVHHRLQQALSPWSRTQSAATDGSPACCTSSLMLRVCVMLRVI